MKSFRILKNNVIPIKLYAIKITERGNKFFIIIFSKI